MARRVRGIWSLLLALAAMLAISTAARAAVSDQDCLVCHGDPGMKSESGRSLAVDPARHKNSVHGDLGCTTCHTGVKEYPHPKPMRKPTCATCHDEPVAQVRQSVHSMLGKDA